MPESQKTEKPDYGIATNPTYPYNMAYLTVRRPKSPITGLQLINGITSKIGDLSQKTEKPDYGIATMQSG